MVNNIETELNSSTWIEQEQFSDARLKKRFHDLQAHLWDGLGQSIPLACQVSVAAFGTQNLCLKMILLFIIIVAWFSKFNNQCRVMCCIPEFFKLF